MRPSFQDQSQAGRRRHGHRARALSLLFAFGLVVSSFTVSPAAAAGSSGQAANQGLTGPHAARLDAVARPHRCQAVFLDMTPPVFTSTVYDYWHVAWGVSLGEDVKFPLGDYDLAMQALKDAIASIENTPACNAAEAQYKIDLVNSLAWYVAYDVCRQHYQDIFLSGGMYLGAVALMTTCVAWPLNRIEVWAQKAAPDQIASGTSTCDPQYSEPPMGVLEGEIYANLADLAYTAINTAGTLKDIYEDPTFGFSKWLAGLAVSDAVKNAWGGGGAGGSFSVNVVAHSTTDLTMYSGTATSDDLSQSLLVVLNPNVTNLNTLAAAHHSVPVTFVGTYTLTGQNPVTVTFPNSSTVVWPYAVGATYHPLDTTNLVDTQSTDPAKNLGGKVTAKVAKSFQATGLAGVPSNATAVTGNLTVKGQSALGYLALTNSNATPTVSTLNFPLGDTRANGATVELDRDGKLWVYYGATAGATTDFVFDVTGYYVEGDFVLGDGAGQSYSTLPAPYRLVDTRSSDGKSQNLGGKLAAGVAKSFQVTGLASPFPNIPAAATAVTGNLTVTQQSAGGYISITNSSASPTVKTLDFPNSPLNDNRAVGVTVKLDGNGKLWLYYGATAGATTHVIFDITGYFVGGSHAYYYPVTPVRTVDTRGTTPGAQTLGGKLTANAAKSFKVAGFAFVPAYNAAGAPTAATGNLTVTGQTAIGYLAVTNTPAAPTVSTLNFPLKDNRANTATVMVGGFGVLYVYYGAVAGNTTDVIFDLTGFYSNATSY